MNKLATKIIDFNDDTSGLLFKEIFPNYEDIPEVIKTASTEEPLEHEYALVMMNNGQKFKKFATHDLGNTVLSVLYFLKTASELPESAIKIASENLINASGRFHLPIPKELKELAEGMQSKGIEVRTREKFWRPLDSLDRVGELDAGRKIEKTAKSWMDISKEKYEQLFDAESTPEMDETGKRVFKGLSRNQWDYNHPEMMAKSKEIMERTSHNKKTAGIKNQALNIARRAKVVGQRSIDGGLYGGGGGAIGGLINSNEGSRIKDTLSGAKKGAIVGGAMGGLGSVAQQVSRKTYRSHPELSDATDITSRVLGNKANNFLGGMVAGSKTAGIIGDGLTGAAFGALGGFAGNHTNREEGAIRGMLPGALMATFSSSRKAIPFIVGGIRGQTDAYYRNLKKEKSNVVDVSKEDDSSPKLEKKAKYTLIGDEFPVDTFEQVKLAQEYFLENWREFPPLFRHEYCVKLSNRAEELGLPLSTEIERYGSEDYSVDLPLHINQRKSFVGEEYHDVLDKLEKKASVLSPDVFAEALGAFDSYMNLDRYWDSRLSDPYRVTFGPSKEKIAEKEWNFTDMGLYINEQDLKTLAYQHIEKVRHQFGQDFAAKFVGDPKRVFEKQNKETKIILARMASHDY